jgi:CBS domain-containing protein
LYPPGLRTCRPTNLLPEAARQMAFAEIGALAVDEGDSDAPVGIVSERDLMWAYQDDPRAVEVGANASPEVHTAETGEHSSVVARWMLDAGVRISRCGEQGRLVGMISMRDLLAIDAWL